MLRKFSLIAAVAAVAAATLVIPAPADAGGRIYRGDHWRGHGRGHWYRGRWWGYGEGPCWRRTPVGWVWICD
jgi:hypothetical protein